MTALDTSVFAIFLISLTSPMTSCTSPSPYSAAAFLLESSASGNWASETNPSNPASDHSSSATCGVMGIMALIHMRRACMTVSLFFPPRRAYQRMSLDMS